ncbi:Mu-like prophage protein gp45 [Hoeflea phototrophica DFL-43]|jgi:phage gp45-like|uniref:Mu-like prophage protein gp45 n=1 Tax=Hoeflea phototrophica (strain DSM 17068 / NCIMB 14078 / DFL-43) TaxID=411684 RepID=A9D4T5_HOEPD|nr:phage baseplate assembly protein [Hoeflea phototrophica]EDQ33956.1 Mu-like prophage protein gp45 [Hoeflea phototrophica DFL-43]
MFDGNLTRFELDGTVEHREGQQFVNGKGFAGDRFERVHRIEPHGFASNPVKGGIGVAMSARGNRDSAYVFGGENPGLRPSVDLGGVKIYDHTGNVVSVVQPEIRIVHSAKVHIIAPEIILEGVVFLGGPGASRPVSAEGTLDSAGHAETSNFAAGVFAT